MEQGPVEENIIKQALQSGRPLPKKIQDAPELQQGLELNYGAFMELSSCRQIGMSEGPIPWSAIHQYCLHYKIDDELREDMFYHVRSMDMAYLKYLEKKHATGLKRRGK